VVVDPAGSAGSIEYDELATANDEASSKFWIQSPPSSQSIAIPASMAPRGSRTGHTVSGKCEQSWWDMLNGTLFCRSGKRARNGTNFATQSVEPDSNLKASHGSNKDAVELSMTVHNVPFHQLDASAQLKKVFAQAVRNEVVKHAGQGIYAKDVKITLAAGSVKVMATITPAAFVDRAYLRNKMTAAANNLAQGVTTALSALPQISGISTGTIKTTAPVVSNPKPPSSSAHHKDNDEREQIMMLIAGSASLAAMILCCLSLFLLKKLRAKGSPNAEIDGTTIAIGRPVNSAEGNPVASSNDVASGLVLQPVEKASEKPSAQKVSQ